MGHPHRYSEFILLIKSKICAALAMDSRYQINHDVANKNGIKTGVISPI
jgi:hypothetical protein